MSMDEWLQMVKATPEESLELRWYLSFLRWRKMVDGLLRSNGQ